MSYNIYELFATKFADARDQPFLVVPDGPSITYGQMDARSAAMAAVLTAKGISPGDRVAVQVDKSIDAVALYLACLRSGFIYLPMNTAYTAEEIGFFLGDATPSAFIIPPDMLAKLQPIADIADVSATLTLANDGTGTLAELADDIDAPNTVIARQKSDVAAMLYTSGTTGRPKGAMLTHGGIAENALALHSIWRFRQGDVLLHCLPIFHVHGLFIALHPAILNASEVIFLPRFNTDEVRANLRRATVMMGVPTYYTRLLEDSGFGPHDCQTIRMFTSGSAPMTEAVFNRFSQRTGHTICERYGMTETGIISSNPPEGDRIAGTVGFALPNMDMRIADQSDKAVEAGEVGQVQVKGPHLFSGYWQLSDKTEQSFSHDGYFRTGDIGSLDDEGRLSLAGRSSDMIISGGYNVYPKEIEQILDDVPGVTETAVVGLPHNDLGEAVTAFVVADPGTDTDMLAKSLDGRLAKFKHPKGYLFVEWLPRNTMGKVQKSKLREDFDQTYTA